MANPSFFTCEVIKKRIFTLFYYIRLITMSGILLTKMNGKRDYKRIEYY